MSENAVQLLIDSLEVKAVCDSCLCTLKELSEKTLGDAVKIEGITCGVAFHPERLKEKQAKVTKWLKLLPFRFRKNGGGGWSILDGGKQENGIQWTSNQEHVEQLFLLGMGLGLVYYWVDRFFWRFLSGKMPYYVIDIE